VAASRHNEADRRFLTFLMSNWRGFSMQHAEQLDCFLPASVRVWIEQTFYARINAQARLEAALADPTFYSDPAAHLALFNDHGVVHVRDVAQQVLRLLDRTHGTLIARREEQRLHGFMKSYGVLLAYLHDIGMIDVRPSGRAMHPEFASQAVFEPAFDHVADAIWQSDRGGIASRLRGLANAGALAQDPRLVLRELLAMANCHSKSKVPVAILNDTSLLREHMQQTIAEDLQVLYHLYQAERARAALARAQQAERPPTEMAELASALRRAEAALAEADPAGELAAARCASLRRHYADFQRDAFQWLVSQDSAVRALAADVVDALRILRCGDALRQRGSLLKTSAGYEIFIDQTSADVLFALRRGAEQLLLTALSVPIAAGESNVASSTLDHDGNLRIAFHRGAFTRPEVVQRAASYTAYAVHDIQADVIDSFQSLAARSLGEAQTARPTDRLQIVLEEVDDNPAFASMVRQQLYALNPQLRGRVHVVPCNRPGQPAAEPTFEDARYAAAASLSWSRAEQRAAAARLARGGHSMAAVELERAFDQVRLILLRAGETLIEAGTTAHYVYVPLGEGLMGMPLGGYQPFVSPAWLPVGNTGVIRGAQRNATIYATCDLTLLIIPQAVYLNAWHRPYQRAELVARLEGAL
jgi:hypothetical protein